VRTIHTLIVDDEPLAREGLRDLLQPADDFEIVGECSDGMSAVKAILSRKPDLVFLDVQMPGMDGFDVLRNVEDVYVPHVIFITAYDTFAIKAFEVHALDYLLKPIDPERFRPALDRARIACARAVNDRSDLNRQLLALLDDLQNRQKSQDRIVIRTARGVISFVKVKEIMWLQAEGDYVAIHTREKNHVVRGTLSEFHEKLDPQQFVRIHRSTVVNIDRIKILEPLFYGEYSVILHDGTKLKLSRSYRKKVQSYLKHAL